MLGRYIPTKPKKTGSKVHHGRRCLDSLFQQPDLDFFHLAVSLDHAPAFDKMEALMKRWHEDVKEILSCFGLCTLRDQLT